MIERDHQSCWTTLLARIYSNVGQVRSNESEKKKKKLMAKQQQRHR